MFHTVINGTLMQLTLSYKGDQREEVSTFMELKNDLILQDVKKWFMLASSFPTKRGLALSRFCHLNPIVISRV